MKLFKLAVYFCWIKTATISGMINRVAVSGDSTNLAEVKDSGEISIVNFSTLNIGVGGGWGQVFAIFLKRWEKSVCITKHGGQSAT